MKSRLLASAAAAALALAWIGASDAAQAAPVKHYASCAAVHRDYSAGISKPGVKYNTVHNRSGTHHRAIKGHVKVSAALYSANTKLDRDKDGIACEKS